MESKTRILIVDDEPINLDFFDVMLSRLGFQVDRAEDGEEALERIKDFQPDLVLLDNIMPKLSGWEFTRILKNDEEYEDFSGTPVIMFSAMDDVKDKVEGFELGVDDYITKPFNFSEVLARIRAVLRHRALSKQVAAKERRLGLIESLNQSLIYFTRHLTDPVVEMQKRARTLASDDRSDVKEFAELVAQETEEVLAALNGLEDEIKDLQDKVDGVEAHDLNLQDMERKFQRHFKKLAGSRDSVEGTS